METTATILHADLDAFYASVEQLLDPSLQGKPIAVGGGVVLAASYEARAFGIRASMPGRRARELCPQLIFVGGHFTDYQRLGDAAMNVLNDFTPLVERMSIDEAFADVAGCTHLFGPPAEIAAAIRHRVRSGGVGETRGTRVEPRSPRDCDAAAGAIGRRTISARQKARPSAGFRAHAASSC
jgi:DNA polymerase-4